MFYKSKKGNHKNEIVYNEIICKNAPKKRSGHKLVIYKNSKLILFGGYPMCDNDFYILNLLENNKYWNKLQLNNNKIIQKRFDHSMNIYKQYCIIFAGRNDCDKVFCDIILLNI